MKGIETGKDKVKKICDILRRETLEPARTEADEIVRSAREHAEDILSAARKEIETLQEEARQEIERQRNVFQSSLAQACKQALTALKQSIEEKLFNKELMRLITSQTQDPKILAQLTTAVVKAIEKEGIEANLSVYIPAAVPARAVNELLSHEIVERLKEKSVLVGPLTGGIEVKLHKENITIDISDAALKELVANYIRKDFREMIFGTV
ncbi:MAG: V-type ATP synthase subunit E [Candidatus Melainabacteria bacterium]|nr:V-type ATP synthase subunit E [Candidatus Melainabacteria bacterium]